MSGVDKKNNGVGVKIIEVAIPAAIGVVAKMADKAIDKPDVNENKIKIPDLYRKGFELELEQAIQILDDFGLKAAPSKISLKEANTKYKDYINNQVLDSNPKQGTYVNQGSIVYLKYITQDVINASQKMFDDNTQAKQDAKEKKTHEKLERKEKMKETISETMVAAKNNIGKIFKKEHKDAGLTGDKQ